METDRKIAASLPPALPTAPPSPAPNGSNNAFPRVRPMHGRTSGPTRRSTRGQWTPEEDEILCKAVQRFKGKNWKKIAECFKDRTDVQCLHRWQKVLNPELIKGPWSKEEDEIIVQLVNKYGPKKWSTISQHLPGRIGKQCRERWHNHLNPTINKEAWTQEEELILIRAHQIHGNKWAELTKYLPGRTDNAIKNHWNSSVKKKLDSYIASGLLAQFQGLPVVSHQNEFIPGASLQVHHINVDDRICKDGTEIEENSECSQVGCSQTASDMSNTACQTREEVVLSEESDHGKVLTTSPIGSYTEQYYPSLDDITFTISDVPCEFSCRSSNLDENFENPGTFVNRDCNFGTISLSDVASLELAEDSTNLSAGYLLVDAKHEIVHGSSHQCDRNGASALVNNITVESEFPVQKLQVKEGCSQVTHPEEGGDGYPSSANLTNCSDIVDMDRYRDSLGFQSSFQVSGTGGSIALQPYNSLNATLGEASLCQNLPSILSEVSEANELTISTKELNHLDYSLTVSQVQAVVNAGEGLTLTNNSSATACHDHIDVGMSEQTDLDSSKLVHVSAFSSGMSDSQQTRPSVVVAVEHTGQQEAGNLCYEPPRFPSLDIPFFSCDLAQPGTDVQQEFSPLGIRQLMMSSMNSLTPFKLWDSPTSDDSPDAVLKSAAKTFACTPSFLKKRNRDLLSPLSPFSERRYDKKTGSDVNLGFLCTSRLTKEFSRLDVMFNEADDGKESPSPSHDQDNQTKTLIEDKENICPDSERQTEEAKSNHDFRDEISEKPNKTEEVLDHDCTISVYQDNASETPRGILVEWQLNDTQFSSPDGTRPKSGFKSSNGASEVYQSFNSASKKLATSESGADNKSGPDGSPCSLGKKKESIDSALSSVMVDSLVNEVGAENLNIFGGTPFRRSIESPSAWKSPWYFNSVVPCPRFDADITIEDIGIFMSPGERSIDALGLMKQINEQNADAYADAREVLGSDTPESILRQRCFRNQDAETEINNVGDSQHVGRLHLASKASTERRILDFSECGTPVKSTEKGKCAVATGLSSPSSLLKSYR